MLEKPEENRYSENQNGKEVWEIEKKVEVDHRDRCWGTRVGGMLRKPKA